MTSKERSQAEANQAHAKLRAELEASEKLVTRLGDLLHRATNAAKGPHPDSLTMHSTHDLPEVVAALAADKRRLDRLQAYGHVEMRSFRYYGERHDTYAVKVLDDECEGASLRAAIDSVVAAIDGGVEEGET